MRRPGPQSPVTELLERSSRDPEPVDGYDDLLGLPLPYVLALFLRDDGAPPSTIAAMLDVEPSSVPALLQLAEAKRLRQRTSAADPAASPSTPEGRRPTFGR